VEQAFVRLLLSGTALFGTQAIVTRNPTLMAWARRLYHWALFVGIALVFVLVYWAQTSEDHSLAREALWFVAAIPLGAASAVARANRKDEESSRYLPDEPEPEPEDDPGQKYRYM